MNKTYYNPKTRTRTTIIDLKSKPVRVRIHEIAKVAVEKSVTDDLSRTSWTGGVAALFRKTNEPYLANV